MDKFSVRPSHLQARYARRRSKAVNGLKALPLGLGAAALFVSCPHPISGLPALPGYDKMYVVMSPSRDPIQGIEANAAGQPSFTTDTYGRVTLHFDYTGDTVTFIDIDGDANGSYQPKSVIVTDYSEEEVLLDLL